MNIWAGGGFCLLLFGLLGCRSLPPLPPADLTEAGWTVRRGQALWQPGATEQEIAGDLLLATHESGRLFVQFSKGGLPVVEGDKVPGGWHCRFFSGQRNFSGAGRPPGRIVWLHLDDILAGKPASGWRLHKEHETLRAVRARSGESLELHFGP